MPNPLHPEKGNPVIERGTRLFQLRQTPGYADLFRISEAIVQQAANAVLRFDGWDKDQRNDLALIAKATLKHHELLFDELDKAVREANEEHEAELLRQAEARTAQAAATEADQLRADTFKKFDDVEREFAGNSISMG